MKCWYCFHIFSLIGNGIGFALSNLGILWLLLMFRCNLHSIKEQSSTRSSWSSSLMSFKFAVFFFVVIFITAISILFPFDHSKNIYLFHVKNNLLLIFTFISIPRYYINQDPNLKIYVSVYHHQPPPVLPWQLPRNFTPNSVKLICVSAKNE